MPMQIPGDQLTGTRFKICEGEAVDPSKYKNIFQETISKWLSPKLKTKSVADEVDSTSPT
jgi:hypothetical protein